MFKKIDKMNMQYLVMYRSSAAQAAIEAAQRINQQLRKGGPKSPPEVSPSIQKPGAHAGLGMVVTEEFRVPDKMVGLSKFRLIVNVHWLVNFYDFYEFCFSLNSYINL